MSSCSAEFSTVIKLLAMAARPVGPSLIWRLRSRRRSVWLEDSTWGRAAAHTGARSVGAGEGFGLEYSTCAVQCRSNDTRRGEWYPLAVHS